MTKKMLIFAPFVYLALWGFILVLFILGECQVQAAVVVCRDGEWQALEGSLVFWGFVLGILPGIVSFGLIRLGQWAIGRLEPQ
jgi:hypothetical protein